MRHKCIRVVPSWQKGPPRYDTVLISTDQQAQGMQGLDVTWVHLFLSFSYLDTNYPCALVDWYDHVADAPNKDMGMWIVKPVVGSAAIVHLDMILRCAHLIPVFGPTYIDRSLKLTFNDSLDAYLSFYVNKYVDHHMHEIVF